MRKDVSLLIIKPEIHLRRKEVKAALKKRGYEIPIEKEYGNWPDTLQHLNPNIRGVLDRYKEAYLENGWGDEYTVLIVHHRLGNTIKRLHDDKGDYKSYQSQDENTLRAEFGLPAEYNIDNCKPMLTFPGIHAPSSDSELTQELKLLGIAPLED